MDGRLSSVAELPPSCRRSGLTINLTPALFSNLSLTIYQHIHSHYTREGVLSMSQTVARLEPRGACEKGWVYARRNSRRFVGSGRKRPAQAEKAQLRPAHNNHSACRLDYIDPPYTKWQLLLEPALECSAPACAGSLCWYCPQRVLLARSAQRSTRTGPQSLTRHPGRDRTPTLLFLVGQQDRRSVWLGVICDLSSEF